MPVIAPLQASVLDSDDQDRTDDCRHREQEQQAREYTANRRRRCEHQGRQAAPACV
jgi:hypothetical protein